MRTNFFAWLVLLALPGCLLVQPLDEAKPADGASNGKAGSSSGGSGNRAGSGPTASGGSGAVANAGAANGGGPSSSNFSLFTGTWTVTDGQTITSCDGGSPKTTKATPGGTDSFGLGTISDLILNPGTSCEILADVTDHSATLDSATQDCTFSDADYTYDVAVDAFDFEVSGDGKTASATLSTTTFLTDANDNLSVCTTDSSWTYKR